MNILTDYKDIFKTLRDMEYSTREGSEVTAAILCLAQSVDRFTSALRAANEAKKREKA